ncbi:hypothetical protein FRC12_001696 [Ceratobasidium sp. 428]|nr:hypothetical protein FRC12_001696 [Ceratobasidium sp. 428]
MTVTPLKHLVFVAGPNWSHVRAGTKFSIRLSQKFPKTYISIYVFAPLVPQANTYLASHSNTTGGRARIIPSVLDSPIVTPLDVIFNVEKSFKKWIVEQLDIASFEAGEHVVAPPSYIIEDHINGGVGLGYGLPITSWWAAPAASLIAHFGNPEHGHGGRLLDSVGAALAKQGPDAEKPIEEIFREVLSDRVVCIPGLPPFYEHEQITQILPPILPFVTQLQTRWKKMRDQMDVALLSGTYEMEPVAAQACATAFTKPVRAFCVGPGVDLPPTIGTEPDSTIEFLDKAHAELGPHSLIYMSFGTLFFPLPQSTRHLEILIEEIVAQGFRLVFALSSEQATVDNQFVEKMTKGGNAIFPKWTNQVKVLEHAAIHYFISHGGWNSTTEAIVRDVPMILWPFAGDQPTNTLQVTAQHDCGFELIQVRTGPAKTTSYPNVPIVGSDQAVRDEIKNILNMSKGARGKQQRINVKGLGKVMRESIGKGGSGDIALGEFGQLAGF